MSEQIDRRSQLSQLANRRLDAESAEAAFRRIVECSSDLEEILLAAHGTLVAQGVLRAIDMAVDEISRIGMPVGLLGSAAMPTQRTHEPDGPAIPGQIAPPLPAHGNAR